jgi:hypothetical protein
MCKSNACGCGGGGGFPVFLAAAVAAAAAVVAFVAAYAAEVAVVAGVFLAVMGAVVAGMRWVASPARMRRQLHPGYQARAVAAAPVRALPAPRKAIGAPRVIPAQVITGSETERMWP